MKALLCMLFSLCLCAVTTAQESLDPSSYPGGSPFPPGEEPSLTHIVEVYWTTVGDMETRIDIRAKGERPTQLHCVKVDGTKRETVISSIAQDCMYKICITPNKEMTDCWNIKGQGSLTVRVYGFNREDFDSPPEVIVQYVKNGHVIGKTQVQAKPVPVKFKTKQVD